MRVKILDVAKELDVSTSSIRLWEKKGLIPISTRTLGGHRRYDLEAIKEFLKKKAAKV